MLKWFNYNFNKKIKFKNHESLTFSNNIHLVFNKYFSWFLKLNQENVLQEDNANLNQIVSDLNIINPSLR